MHSKCSLPTDKNLLPNIDCTRRRAIRYAFAIASWKLAYLFLLNAM